MTLFLVDALDGRDVLARVVMLFHRRAIVIRSFSMAPAEHPGIVRMAIGVETDRTRAEHTVADLRNLVNVLSVKSSWQDRTAERVPVTTG
jgi:acetolactate synthase small subunit